MIGARYDYESEGWRDLLTENGLHGFDDVWNLPHVWVQKPNGRHGGFAGVARHELIAPDGSSDAQPRLDHEVNGRTQLLLVVVRDVVIEPDLAEQTQLPALSDRVVQVQRRPLLQVGLRSACGRRDDARQTQAHQCCSSATRHRATVRRPSFPRDAALCRFMQLHVEPQR